MPKRQSVQRHFSDEVQGEGSWVILAAVKVREIRVLRKLGDNPKFDEFEGGIKLLTKHIVDWNWVDDEGEPLPKPRETADVIDELTNGETEFLVNLLIGSSKN